MGFFEVESYTLSGINPWLRLSITIYSELYELLKDGASINDMK